MRKYYYWLPVVAYMGIIFYFSNKPGSQISLPTPDYVAHGVEYFGLGFLVLWAVRGWNQGKESVERFPEGRHNLRFYPYVCALAFCVLYGLSDEFHQSFIPGRTESLSDLAADTIGAALAQVAWWIWLHLQPGNSISRK